MIFIFSSSIIPAHLVLLIQNQNFGFYAMVSSDQNLKRWETIIIIFTMMLLEYILVSLDR